MTEFSPTVTPPMMVAPGCDPDASLDHGGLCDHEGTPLGRFNWTARRDDAHVRPDHHIIGKLDPAKVVMVQFWFMNTLRPTRIFSPPVV
jgi:hypothetical protein